MSTVLDAPKTASIAELRRPSAPEQSMPVVRAGFGDLQGFELMQRACKALAASTLVPAQFQNNLPNCIIALEMAQRIGASPLMVMQNLYIVHGRPGWSAKFLIASFNQCGRFSALRFEWVGERGKDEWGCRAWAVEKATGERIQGPLITIALAKEEGWYGKSGSKWKTIPELMLTYRAAAWLVNTHAPEISMGLNTAEEMGDVYDATAAGDGMYTVTTDDLRGDAPATGGQSSNERGPTPDPMKDPQTAAEARMGESSPAQQQQSNVAPTLEDAVAAVKSGDYDMAREIARGLGGDAQATIEATIKSREGNAQQARQRRDRPANVE